MLADLPSITLPSVKGRADNRKTANSAVTSARASGFLLHAGHCTACREFVSAQNFQAHHDDYAKPFEVIMLCCKCHRERHRQLGWGVCIKAAPAEEATRRGVPARVIATALRRLLMAYRNPLAKTSHTHYVAAVRILAEVEGRAA